MYKVEFQRGRKSLSLVTVGPSWIYEEACNGVTESRGLWGPDGMSYSKSGFRKLLFADYKYDLLQHIHAYLPSVSCC